jgi:GntR family transcriptional regulator of abcA and norABC
MEWRPNKLKKLPLYKQIANYLESRIINGEFPPGSRLPSERELAHQLDVNRSTVNAAFEELRSTGLVNRIVGYGTVVNKELWRSGHSRVPNWDQYVKEGFDQPNNPLNQQIYRYIGSDERLINFAIGELSADLCPTKWIQSITESLLENKSLGYENVQGNLQLRETISDHLKQYRHIESTPSSILITSGAQQAIHLIIRGLLHPGDSVAIEDPSYAYSLPIFHSKGLNTHLLPVHENGIDPEQIVAIHKKHRLKMVFLNPTYQNPTCVSLDIERRRKVMEICTNYGIVIVEDDPYSLLGYQQPPIPTLKSMDQEGLVLYVSSLSKIVASGLRIGWILGPQNVINRLTDVKQQMDFGQPNLPQWIAANLLQSEHFKEHIEHLQIELKKKRDLTIQALQKELNGNIHYFIPNGGIHLWCRLNDDQVDEKLLFQQAVKNGMVFAPGNTLGSHRRYIRFTYGRVNTDSITEGIQRFAKALKTLM